MKLKNCLRVGLLALVCLGAWFAALRVGYSQQAQDWLLYLPYLLRGQPVDDITLTDIWTADGQANRTDQFTSGEAIVYYAAGQNTSERTRDVDLAWMLESPCGASTIYTDTLSLSSGNWTTAFTQTVPACSGVYTYTFQVGTAWQLDITSTVFTVTNPLVVTARAQPAFDKCDNPSLGQLEAWWQRSPYRIVNIYIGGIHRHCANEDLTPAWVAGALSQGWALIPTWVGPQAPCSDFKYRFSADPAEAYAQGRSEADAAALAAASLGLTSQGLGGTIIYYDIEYYIAGNKPECRAAVGAFLSGWVSRLHELGNRAGAYGGACSSYITEWASIPHVPDDVWIAAWYAEAYDPEATVWGVPCVSDDLWPNHQRIRQYAGDHSEAWGGVRMDIDSNVVDGEVLERPSRTQPVVSTGMILESASSNLTDFQRLTHGQGWALDSGRLYWTEDSGLSWQVRSPQDAIIQAAFFRDASSGWLVAAQPRLLVYATVDGGGTWQPVEIPGAPPGAVPLALTFIDSERGWLSLSLPSSANFNLGLLYRTQDGGQSWQALPLPGAGSVHFNTPEIGWALVEDILYCTRDGGQSWTVQSPILPGEAGAVFYSLPTFFDPQSGLLPVTLLDPYSPRMEIYATADGGLTWTMVSALPLQPEDALLDASLLTTFLDPQHWWVAHSSGDLHLSQDGGHTWQLYQATLPRGALKMAFEEPQAGWLLTSGGDCTSLGCTLFSGLWQTSDGGLTWMPLTLSP
ncbi:MAG: DUF1906 domain-containing protein [Anaerolineales bacterium]|nr:DUF1906 domain-containing protein [Anaerolineales bacterium]